MRNSRVRSRANPKFRYGLLADLRSENWDIRNSFQGPAPLLGSLNLRREAVGANFSSFENGRWHWSAGVEASHRDFRSVIPGVALTPSLLAKGYQLKQVTTAGCRPLALAGEKIDPRRWRCHRRPDASGRNPPMLLRSCKVPPVFIGFRKPRARTMKCSTRSGRARHLAMFRSTNSLCWDWSATTICGCGDTSERAMAEKAARRWERLFSVQLGSGQERVWNGIFTVKLGPFLDTGKITDPSSGLGSHKWLWDMGAQAKAAGVWSRSGVFLWQGSAIREQCVLCFDAVGAWQHLSVAGVAGSQCCVSVRQGQSRKAAKEYSLGRASRGVKG